MSGIALLLAQRGFVVSGSDLVESGDIIVGLRAAGVVLYSGHCANNIKGVDIVVMSSAIDCNNVELQAAGCAGIRVLKRAEVLAEIMQLYGQKIAVAGTHGKTTTTGIIANIFDSAGVEPTLVLGGQVKSSSKQVNIGANDYFITEADESDKSFLYLQPNIAVITSVDLDHMEIYSKSLHNLENAFIDFAHKVPKDGVVVIAADDVKLVELAVKIKRRCVTYGFTAGVDFQVIDYSFNKLQSSFKLRVPTGEEITLVVNCPGTHNIMNAVAATVVARQNNIDWQAIKLGLIGFSGVKRRFDYLGDVCLYQNSQPITVIDDYGHHPEAIKVTLVAARQIWPKRRVVLCFEPHKYSRLNFLLEGFIAELSKADLLILLPVYSCGEEILNQLDSNILRSKISTKSFYSSFDDLQQCLVNNLAPNDVLIAQGAGGISKAIRGIFNSWLVEHKGEVVG